MKQHPAPEVKGEIVDQHTRCVHYSSPSDIIAIKFKCCSQYYPCFFCHQEEAGHPHAVWSPDEFDTKAILCGNCNIELSIKEYLESGNTCPSCSASFNPKCVNHYHYYFEAE